MLTKDQLRTTFSIEAEYYVIENYDSYYILFYIYTSITFICNLLEELINLFLYSAYTSSWNKQFFKFWIKV